MIFCALLVSFSLAKAQMWEIDPAQLNPKTTKVTSNHTVYLQSQAPQKLLISIGGTGSSTIQFAAFNQAAADLGYAVLSIDYPNLVTSLECRKYQPDCYDFYRREIAFGQNGSPLVAVNRKNSILFRIQSLLQYLHNQNPAVWGTFFDGAKIHWDKIVLAGHSQGAGHAAYLAKNFYTAGVILFSGPHDYSPKGAAPWLLQPSKTPENRFFAFLHEKDFFGLDNQLMACRLLVGDSRAAISEIQTDPVEAKTQILVSNFVITDPHNALLLPVFDKVWNFLLRRLD